MRLLFWVGAKLRRGPSHLHVWCSLMECRVLRTSIRSDVAQSTIKNGGLPAIIRVGRHSWTWGFKWLPEGEKVAAMMDLWVNNGQA